MDRDILDFSLIPFPRGGVFNLAIATANNKYEATLTFVHPDKVGNASFVSGIKPLGGNG